MGAQHLTQQEKAKLYDDMMIRYQRMQEQVRQIKAKNLRFLMKTKDKSILLSRQ